AAAPHGPAAAGRLGGGAAPRRRPDADGPRGASVAGDARAPVAPVRCRRRAEPEARDRPGPYRVRGGPARQPGLHRAAGGADPRLRLAESPGQRGAPRGGGVAAGAARGRATRGAATVPKRKDAVEEMKLRISD